MSDNPVVDAIPGWAAQAEHMSAEERVSWAAKIFGSRVLLASSLGLEDQVLADMVSRVAPEVSVFTLDTGRLFPETYDLLQRTRERYGLTIKVFFPDAHEVEEMVNSAGPNLFRWSVEQRKRCCFVRKVQPLRRALAGQDAWICGLRREQSDSRDTVQRVEWDETNGLVKINPLADWTAAQVRAYIAEHRVPYNTLHDKGFPSIGCACCTRAVLPGEDIRAGRWWWEAPEKKECGLHWKDGKLVRAATAPLEVAH